MKEKILKIKDSKQYVIIDCIIFVALLVMTLYAMGLLFYRQATTVNGAWPSDIYSYIEEIIGINTTYPYPYPIMFQVGRLFYKLTSSPELSIVIAGIIFNGLAVIITKSVIEKQTRAPFISTCTTISLFFLSMIYGSVFSSLGITNRYEGVCTPNPWHNMTYMAARPFMVLAFVFGALTLRDYEQDFSKGNKCDKKTITKYVAFSLSLLLVTMTKPSYTLVHLGTAAIIMLFRLIKAKGKNFRQTFILGVLYIPTLVDMLYQYFEEFTGGAYVGTEQGIGFQLFKVWSVKTNNIPLAIVLAAAFPLVTLIIHWKDLKTDSQFRFSWQIFAIAIGMASIFYEKGYTESHGNFFWGYECALFLVFLAGIIKVINDTINLIRNSFTVKQTLLVLVQWAFLAVHTLMGLNYFHLLLAYGINYR